MPTEALEFPLAHPDCVICNNYYDDKVFKIVYPSKLKKVLSKIKRMILK
jgi:hypothetical protein